MKSMELLIETKKRYEEMAVLVEKWIINKKEGGKQEAEHEINHLYKSIEIQEWLGNFIMLDLRDAEHYATYRNGVINIESEKYCIKFDSNDMNEKIRTAIGLEKEE